VKRKVYVRYFSWLVRTIVMFEFIVICCKKVDFPELIMELSVCRLAVFSVPGVFDRSEFFEKRL
jgi:hypothetical protein